VWAATWLYKATNNNYYLQYLIRNGNALGGATQTMNVFSWDNKYAGAQVLLAQVRLLANAHPPT
jgi:endoglucanase